MGQEKNQGEVTEANQASGNSSGSGNDANKNIIPSDTRQQMLPFLLDPNSTDPQTFSFRKNDITGGLGQINIIPDDRFAFDKDIGMQMLLSKYLKDEKKKGLSTKDIIFDNLPAIQIREYTQDTKLDLLWNLLKYGIQGAKDGSKEGEDRNAADFKQTAKLTGNQVTAFANTIAKKIQEESFWEELMTKLSTWFNTSCFGVNDVYDIDTRTTLIIQAVYCLYYRMIGSTTTNRYILPYDGQEIFNTNGSEGWPGANQFGFGGTSKFSVFGKLLNFALGGNVKVVTQPIWSGTFGSNMGSIQMKLSLFNDTYEHAMNNFIFVNTIFPQNMFLQYGIWQQPPSVYDIKIEGGRRWFMCSGNFQCSYKGVMRNMNEDFVKELVLGQINPNIEIGPDYFIERKLIKVPDVYELTLNFNSLLPDNFNQYLFQYAANNNISNDKTIRQEPWYQEGSGPAYEYINNIITEVSKEAEKVAPELPNPAAATKKAEELASQEKK